MNMARVSGRQVKPSGRITVRRRIAVLPLLAIRLLHTVSTKFMWRTKGQISGRDVNERREMNAREMASMRTKQVTNC